MKNFELTPQKRKNSKVLKAFDLKDLDLPKNSEQNESFGFRKIHIYGTIRNKVYKIKPKDFSEEIIKDDNKLKNQVKNHKEEKIKLFLNDKSTNNKITNNIFYQPKKIYYSQQKFKSNDNLLLLSEGNIINSKNKNKTFNLNLQNKINHQHHNSSKTNNNLFPQFTKINNKKDYNDMVEINRRIKKKITGNSFNSKSVKHQTTVQSNISTFVPFLSHKNDINLIKDKMFKEKTYININKKNISKAVFSQSKLDNMSNIKRFTSLIKYKRKYPFIINPKPIFPDKYVDLPISISKMNKKFLNILKTENDKVFRHYFSIIPKEKFSKKFQNITNYEINDTKKFKNKNNNNETKENDEITDLYINEDIISGKNLLKEIKEMKQKNKEIKINKKALFNKLKKYLILLKSKLTMMSVYLNEIIENYKIPTASYGFFNTHELIFAIKSKNIKLASNIIDNNRNIVLDYDYFNMTPLHWAAKCNFYHIIPKLIEYGAYVDEKNFVGETPLLISVKHNYIESAIFLLLSIASPFVKDNKGLGIFNYLKNDFKIINLFKKAISLHYISFFRPTKNKIDFIQTKFIEFIIDEYKNEIENRAYNLIKERMEYYKRKKNIGY